MGDIAQQQGDVMSENSIPVVAYWFTSIRCLIICNDVECAKSTTRRVEVDHTVDVIFDHPQWPTYWLIIGRGPSSIFECCPDKETIDVGSSTPGFAVGTLIVSRPGKHQLRWLDNLIATSSADVPHWARQDRYAGDNATTEIFFWWHWWMSDPICGLSSNQWPMRRGERI